MDKQIRLKKGQFLVLAESADAASDGEAPDALPAGVETETEGGQGHDGDDVDAGGGAGAPDWDGTTDDAARDWEQVVNPFDPTMLEEAVETPDVSDALRDLIAKAGVKRDVAQPYTPHPGAVAADREFRYEVGQTCWVGDGGRALLPVAVAGYDRKTSAEVIGDIRALVQSSTQLIAAELRRLLSTQSLSRTIRDRERGRLDRQRLHTLNRPGARPNRNVFMDVMRGDSHTTGVTVLVDQSGSMGENMGRKIELARAATMALADALHSVQIRGLQFEVLGFDCAGNPLAGYVPQEAGTYGKVDSVKYDRCTPLRLHIYKEAHESWPTVAERLTAMRALGANVDGESIRWAMRRSLAMKVDRRILIVLSDGNPQFQQTSGRSHIRVQDARDAVVECAQSGVEVLGIGIMTNATQKIYAGPHIPAGANVQQFTISDVSELQSRLLGAMRAMLDTSRRAA